MHGFITSDISKSGNNKNCFHRDNIVEKESVNATVEKNINTAPARRKYGFYERQRINLII